MKIYNGIATGTVVGPKIVQVNGKPLRHVVIHSPSGFNWGYGGSGPADLAYAILLDMYGKDFADEFYQVFKWDVVSALPQGKAWQFTESDLEEWRKTIRQ